MNKKLYTLAILPVMGLALLGTHSAYAFGGDGQGQHTGGMYRGNQGNGAGLVSQKTRGVFRAECQALSTEEREVLHGERMEMREEHRGDMEAFTGLTHEEMRELHRNGESTEDALKANGITEEDAEAFLTERANERVDTIVEQRNLDSAEEETLRERIADFVNRILDRWF